MLEPWIPREGASIEQKHPGPWARSDAMSLSSDPVNSTVVAT